MPCDTVRKPQQTLAERKAEVRKRMLAIDKLIATGKIKVKVGKQGAVAFTNLADADRDGITDACIYRMVMLSGSAAAKLAILKAEQAAGVSVNKKVVARGIHSHDGGATWHPKG